MGYPQCGHADALSETSPLHSGHFVRAMCSSTSGWGSLVFVVLSVAEHDVLDHFSCLEGDGGSWGGKHATELGDLPWHQAVDGPPDTAFQEAEAWRVLELLLQPTEPLRGSAHQVLGLAARPLGRPFCLLSRPLVLRAAVDQAACELAERVLRLSQFAGAQRGTRGGQTLLSIIVADPEPKGAAPLYCLERAEPLGLGTEYRNGSLRSDLHARAAEPPARRSRVSMDAGQRGVEAFGRALDALDRAIHSLQ